MYLSQQDNVYWINLKIKIYILGSQEFHLN
ncbi:hypothetical protein ACIN8IBEIGE_50178 [Acinetobacter sp. 8I-beige]|nr:hypothetical protein ACIN8IBEIGE_50178 [Acinetobacter sp. 8I-beige]